MASRQEEKERRRRERMEREQAEKAAASRRKRLQFAFGGLLSVLVIAGVVVLLVVGVGGGGGAKGDVGQPSAAKSSAKIPAQQTANLKQAAQAAGCKLVNAPIEGNTHETKNFHESDYKTNPPTSGNHFEIPAADGAYNQAPDVEPLVHSLEHGRIIFWFKPGAPAQLQGQMKALFDEDNFHVILAPYSRGLSGEVAASAWTRSIVCPKVNDSTWDALRLFRDRYRDQGPEQVA